MFLPSTAVPSLRVPEGRAEEPAVRSVVHTVPPQTQAPAGEAPVGHGESDSPQRHRASRLSTRGIWSVFARDWKFSRDLRRLVREYTEGCEHQMVLDVGCGEGRHTVFFLGNGNTVHGLDVRDYRPLHRPPFIFALYDGTMFPYADQSFDLVASFDVLEHAEDDQAMVREMWRVLKSGGRVFAGTPNRMRLGNLLRTCFGLFPIQYPWHLDTHPTLGKIVHVREYTAPELAARFVAAGFQEVRVRPFWFGFRMGGIEWLSIPTLPFLTGYTHYLFLTAVKS